MGVVFQLHGRELIKSFGMELNVQLGSSNVVSGEHIVCIDQMFTEMQVCEKYLANCKLYFGRSRPGTERVREYFGSDYRTIEMVLTPK